MYEDEKVVLETHALHPFQGGWCDWYGTKGEAVVTFVTMKHVLWNAWRNQCVDYVHEEEHETVEDYLNCNRAERVVTPESFDASDLQNPGIHRDSTHYEDEEKVDESYTIVLPHEFMSEKLCRNWVEKLNEEFDRNFVLFHEPAFKQMWRENRVARYDPKEDSLHLYTENLEGVEEIETEHTRYEIMLKRDADTGKLVGFSLPNFSKILSVVEAEVRQP